MNRSEESAQVEQAEHVNGHAAEMPVRLQRKLVACFTQLQVLKYVFPFILTLNAKAVSEQEEDVTGDAVGDLVGERVGDDEDGVDGDPSVLKTVVQSCGLPAL